MEINTEKDFSSAGTDEKVIGVMDVSDAYKVQGFTLHKFYCGNCKKTIHSTPGKYRCNNSNCECKCQTHYIGVTGQLIPYGYDDPARLSLEKESKPNKETDLLIEAINKSYREEHKVV